MMIESETIIGTPTLAPKLLFGQRTNIKKNAHYVTDLDIVYPCGAVLIFQNFVNNTQKYISLADKANTELLLVSPRRNYIAVMDNTGEKGKVHIYESMTLKRKRTLTLPLDMAASRFEWMDISYDERFVMVITGPPDWMMISFNWERGKMESFTRANYPTNPTAPVREVVCSPVDSNLCIIFGKGIFRLMNLQENTWRQYGFQKADHLDLMSCCYLGGERIVCGTTDGLLLLIEMGELKFVFQAQTVEYINAQEELKREDLPVKTESSVTLDKSVLEEEDRKEKEKEKENEKENEKQKEKKKENEKEKEKEKGKEETSSNAEREDKEDGEEEKEDIAVRALTPLSNGFAFSCKPGMVHFFEKSGKHVYKKRNIYVITDKDFRENQSKNITIVKHLSVNVSETKMMATTDRCQLYEIKLWGPEMDIAGLVSFKHLGYSLHTGPIGDLSLCLWKPIFMTCGKIDRTVRLWNYETVTLEMMKQYQEDVHSVSLHPTGLYSAIGFSDKLRLMVVLIDDLQVSREFPIRECLKSSFGHTGQLLAAVNRSVIQLYSTITHLNAANLKGHSGTIKSLEWSRDDRKMVSCGTDGAIYEWDMNSFKRVGEIVNKGVAYLECSITSDGKYIYAIGSDNLLKEISDSNITRSIDLKQTDMNHVVLSRSDLMMFISSEKGWIMTMNMPILDPPVSSIFHFHSTSVLQMKLALDDKTLVTCAESGTICVWKLDNCEGRTIVLDDEFSYFKEILISKNDLEEKLSSIKDLTQRIFEMEMEHTYQLRHLETVYKEKINDIRETYTQALEELKVMLEVMEGNHNVELNNISSDMNIMKERHEAEMLEMEAKYNAELIVEYNKIIELEKTKERVTKEFGIKLEHVKASKEKTIEDLTRINESKLYNLNKMVEEAREEINKEITEHTALINQIESDNDREIESMKSKYEKTIKSDRESNIRLKGELGVLKKKILSAQKEIEFIQMQIINVLAEHEKLKGNITGLEQDIIELKKEIADRDFRIQEKEKKIYDLNRKDQELERYKFVLKYRIKELRNQIEPRDKQIKEKKEQIAEMEVELGDLQKVNIALDGNLSTLREKLNSVYKLLHTYKVKYNNTMSVIKRVKTDIYMASAYIKDPKKLVEVITKLYNKYITDSEFIKARQTDEECVEELKRQKEYLEKIVVELETEVGVRKQVHYGEGMIYMEMNWALMDEIFKIRKKLKAAQLRINDIETLICVRIGKSNSPGNAAKLVRKALTNLDDVKEECQIKMEEATGKAALMKEELENLLERLAGLENEMMSSKNAQKKKRAKEVLKFDIPII